MSGIIFQIDQLVSFYLKEKIFSCGCFSCKSHSIMMIVTIIATHSEKLSARYLILETILFEDNAEDTEKYNQ